MEEVFHLDEELKKIPACPGVYLMHNALDEIIYVGKAISLKNRVRQYFQSGRNRTPKIEKMISQIAWFEYIITDSELEALVLECNLIKEHNPRYNTMLKDDKAYPFIKATVGEPYPRLVYVHRMEEQKRRKSDEKVRYFGPFTSVTSLKETLELMRKLFFLRTCSRKLPQDVGKERPCLYYHIKQCKAPCQGYITEEEYQENFHQAMELLNGNDKPVCTMLEEKMKQCALEMEYEQAAVYRDLIQSVKHVSQKQKITGYDGDDRDVIALASDDRDAIVQVFFIRGGKLIGRDHFHLTGVEVDGEEEAITEFIKQFYAGTPYIPRELYLQEQIPDQQLLEQWLTKRRGQKVTIRVPQKGQKERLVELALRNAQLVLSQDKEKLERIKKRTKGALEEICSLIGLTDIHRVESYDISNINGFDSVGSMVVFVDGKAKKNDYRKFRIRTVTGPDDYASMYEVLTRRFLHGLKEQEEQKVPGDQMEREEREERRIPLVPGEQKHPEDQKAQNSVNFEGFAELPDLILMDGGKGQVHIAKQVLEELGLVIPVCGMVKDDHHRTRGLYFEEEELPIDIHSEGFHLITRIQDETHRFAIEYHKSIRSKTQVHSILDDIPGIGPKRRRELLKKFQSLDAIKAADEELLSEVPSMNREAARKVYEFFHQSSEKVNRSSDGGKENV